MSNVEISVFNIARTAIDNSEVTRWLTRLEADDFIAPAKDKVSDPAFLIAIAGKRCYMSFQVGLNPNVTKIREDYVAYFDNILRSKHGSVLEHSSYTYAIEGVSRVFTAEMNRHRAGMAISEGSLRFIRFDKDIPWWVPTSLRISATDDEDLRRRKDQTKSLFEAAFKHQEECYSEALKIWDMEEHNHNFSYKKQVTSCLRRIVGMGVATGGVWTGNIRALRHIISMRTAPEAEEEIALVFKLIADDIISKEPLLFSDFTESGGGSFIPSNWKV